MIAHLTLTSTASLSKFNKILFCRKIAHRFIDLVLTLSSKALFFATSIGNLRPVR